MTPNAEIAYKKLVEMGVSVMPWGVAEGCCKATQFVIIWASDDGNEIFADIDGHRIREDIVNGRLTNCSNIREDIHVVLEQHKLWTDWQTSGQLCVMDGPHSTGYDHDRCHDRMVKRTAEVAAHRRFKSSGI